MDASPLAVRLWELVKKGGDYTIEEVKQMTQAPSVAAVRRAMEELEELGLLSLQEEDV